MKDVEIEYWNGKKWVKKLPKHFVDRIVKTRWVEPKKLEK